ncbi:hypothetical protein [Pseudomonas capsici]|uniref:Uncharacterized protein n=1 Tax=Pseudomonas capsici TaxID=2810614 RepID=A0ABT3BYT8_9PSED|nr:hypothetical protein [Pseudomonas capsici]GFM63498.1 hypothetical protein PSCICG_46580 [Pseudomonas cichorii]MBN6715806.1 hypothetical protein [Pseudomonas capsici]MBN6720942.1 hypothetical protein [Pseudomonas capsici]MBN6725708.1 hypothetical protein [Pseudomonas capsici]MCV4264663.1 hypothetical protein [Pseudomonas capsici]
MISDRNRLFGKNVKPSGLFRVAVFCFLTAAILDFHWYYIGFAGMFAAVATVIRPHDDDELHEISGS